MANEKRLIVADALLEKLSRMIDYCQDNELEDEMSALFQVGDAVMDCPTVDAVEVVRCKDCKHWQVYIDALGDECPFGDCSVNEHDYEITIETDKDDFCSYGERRTDDVLL